MLDREVAIKVLRADVARDATLVARFRREAGALARPAHPNIAVLHGLGEQDGVLYMVMEFVRGDSLEDMLQRSGRLDWPVAAEMCCAVLDALAHAHAMGVVHRDVKPANVMVTRNGTVK